MTIPRSIRRRATLMARAADTTPRPAVERRERIDGQLVVTREYREADGSRRVETTRTHAVLRCCVCGAPAEKNQTGTYCFACGEGSGLTLAAPAR